MLKEWKRYRQSNVLIDKLEATITFDALDQIGCKCFSQSFDVRVAD